MAEDKAQSARVVRVVQLVAILNLAYFAVEFVVASRIESVSLFADSIDFLEDACVNFLIVDALGWTTNWRARVGMLLACLLLVPAIATGLATWQKVSTPLPPAAIPLSLTGAGALAVNLACGAMLVRVRHHVGSLTRAAFLSARNDALANVGIVAAGIVTAYVPSAWPDLIVGLVITLINVDAARHVYLAAWREREAPTP